MLNICNKCGLEKDLDKFVKDKSRKNGIRNRCRECENLIRRKTPLKPKPREGYKYCASCKEEKLLKEYPIRMISGKKRVYSYCRECDRVKSNSKYNNQCMCCGIKYKSGRKNTIYCKKCHDNHVVKTYSKLHLIDLSGEKNGMFGKQRFGRDNPNYKNSKTEEEREKGRFITGYGLWRESVYKRDKYTCKSCGDSKGGNLNAHHLNSYDWAKEERLSTDNGVTLCKSCHIGFHNEYGYGNNTKDQFLEYIRV